MEKFTEYQVGHADGRADAFRFSTLPDGSPAAIVLNYILLRNKRMVEAFASEGGAYCRGYVAGWEEQE